MVDALGAGAQAVKRKISDFNESAKMRLLAGAGSKAEPGSGKKPPTQPRTMAQPDFGDGENDKPIDVMGEATPLASKAKDEFETSVVHLGLKQSRDTKDIKTA